MTRSAWLVAALAIICVLAGATLSTIVLLYLTLRFADDWRHEGWQQGYQAGYAAGRQALIRDLEDTLRST